MPKLECWSLRRLACRSRGVRRRPQPTATAQRPGRLHHCRSRAPIRLPFAALRLLTWPLRCGGRRRHLMRRSRAADATLSAPRPTAASKSVPHLEKRLMTCVTMRLTNPPTHLSRLRPLLASKRWRRPHPKPPLAHQRGLRRDRTADSLSSQNLSAQHSTSSCLSPWEAPPAHVLATAIFSMPSLLSAHDAVAGFLAKCVGTCSFPMLTEKKAVIASTRFADWLAN